MLLMKELIEYPEGSDKLISLLQKFQALKIEQIVVFFMQTDKTFNRERVMNVISELKNMDVIVEKSGLIKLSSTKNINENVVNAFWAFLHFVDENTVFDQGSYPSEIIFKKDDVINEIIVMDNEGAEKMDYLSKRKHRKNKCHYNFLFVSGTIDELDDELFPDVPITLITISDIDNITPKLTYHEVSNV